MRIVLFYHSLVSDWNHGNAHFLRGVTSELLLRGHDVRVYEPLNGWSRTKLLAEHGHAPIDEFHETYPDLAARFYDPTDPHLDHTLADADLVIVHEWSDPNLVAEIGRHRATRGSYSLLFHDTHHRAVMNPQAMSRYDLSQYDGVLAFGNVLRELYLGRRWTSRAWTWHEAADTRLFRPIEPEKQRDLVWIGNWGDEERTSELHEFLLGPVRQLKLKARIHGVRYPEDARRALQHAGIEYARWLPNCRAPQTYARFQFTVHVPRRPYVEALPGIPTIRVFEALACGIPLICSPWRDSENLFTPGQDYLLAPSGSEMKVHMRALLNEPELRQSLIDHGRRAILARHTCAHRVDELLAVAREVRAEPRRNGISIALGARLVGT